MRRHLAFMAAFLSVAVVSLAVPSGAQTTSSTNQVAPPKLTVTGTVACTFRTYAITWTLTNTSQTTVEFMGGVLSGAATGAVQFSPSVINHGATMTGVASVPGATKGTVTISVSTLVGNVGSADYPGSVQLAGTCAVASPAPATQAQAGFTG